MKAVKKGEMTNEELGDWMLAMIHYQIESSTLSGHKKELLRRFSDEFLGSNFDFDKNWQRGQMVFKLVCEETDEGGIRKR